ncbi:hypothetical protein [Austwickia sp. TVS 96-490-7B]|nr:hypothetical protein [Austwickia sp. TVS 96-490-7B]
MTITLQVHTDHAGSTSDHPPQIHQKSRSLTLIGYGDGVDPGGSTPSPLS